MKTKITLLEERDYPFRKMELKYHGISSLLNNRYTLDSGGSRNPGGRNGMRPSNGMIPMEGPAPSGPVC
jgi:hypothetical protein